MGATGRKHLHPEPRLTAPMPRSHRLLYAGTLLLTLAWAVVLVVLGAAGLSWLAGLVGAR